MSDGLGSPQKLGEGKLPRGHWLTSARDRLQRTIIFRRAMRAFLYSPEECQEPQSPVLSRLIFGWGNELYSGWHEYLAACVRETLASKGPILECGSGLSTLIVGTIAKRRQIQHIALEHMPQWAAQIRRVMRKYDVPSVVQTAPLRDYGTFAWYDAPSNAVPASIATVICDGPPGDTKGGRAGLVPLLANRFAPGCVILLDDASRPVERETIEQWIAQVSATTQIFGRVKPYARIVLQDAQTNARL